MARNRNDQGEKGDTLLTRQDSMNRRRELPKTEEQEREYLNQIFIDLYSICKELLSDNQSVPLKVDATTINAYQCPVLDGPFLLKGGGAYDMTVFGICQYFGR